MPIYRKDVKNGDCFQYASLSNARNKFFVCDVRPADLPSDWNNAQEGCGSMLEEVRLIPHYNAGVRSERLQEEETRLLSAYTNSMHCADDKYHRTNQKMHPEDKATGSILWSEKLRELVKIDKEKERNKVSIDWGCHWDDWD